MAEFTELPCAVGEMPKDDWWDELRLAIINRQEALDEIYSTALDPASNPTDISTGDLWVKIAEYRAAIDAMVSYFYTSGTSRTAYTANSLHTAAFGQNAWRGTPPCMPSLNVWNDMKACLDLMLWVRIYLNTASVFVAWTHAANSYYKNQAAPGPVWNTVRAEAFTDLIIVAPPITGATIGRTGLGDLTGATYDATAFASTDMRRTFATPGDLTGVTNPPSLTDGYAIVNWTAGADYHTNVDLGWELAGSVVNGSPFTFDPSTDTGYIPKQLSAANLAALNLDTNDNLWKLTYGGDIAVDIGAVEWPAPTGLETWYQGFLFQSSDQVFIKLSWA